MTIQSVEDLQRVLDKARAGFSLRRVSWDESGPWQLRDGALSHSSGGFFSVAGVATARGRAVYLYQPQSALTGLLTTHIRGEMYALLQARVEPGTLGVAQFGPTIQSTPANYLRLHGGQSTPYLAPFTCFDPAVRPYHDSMQLDLGERYWMKSKRLILAACSPDLPVLPNYVWVPASVLQQGVLCSAFFNTDLRALLALLPWQAEGLPPRVASVARSLAAARRPTVLGSLLARLSGAPPDYRFIPLDQVDGWQFAPDGLAERVRTQGFDIALYEVAARGREVARWIQPMAVSPSPGRAVLACREQAGVMEVLVSASRESGLKTGAAILPSFLRYPGCVSAAEDEIDWEAMPLLAATTESDEGGRFYQSVSQYELRWSEHENPFDDPGAAWVRLSELKALLQTSNCCSIQLRGMASMLVGSVF